MNRFENALSKIKYSLVIFVILVLLMFVKNNTIYASVNYDRVIKVVNPINEHTLYYNDKDVLLAEVANDKTIVDFLPKYGESEVYYIVSIDCSKSVYLPNITIKDIDGNDLDKSKLPYEYIKNKFDKRTLYDIFCGNLKQKNNDIYDNYDSFYAADNRFIAEKRKYAFGSYHYLNKNYGEATPSKINQDAYIDFYDTQMNLIKRIDDYSLYSTISIDKDLYYIIKNEKFDNVSVDKKYPDRYSNAKFLYNIMDKNLNILLDHDAVSITIGANEEGVGANVYGARTGNTNNVKLLDNTEIHIVDYFTDYIYDLSKKQIVTTYKNIDIEHTELNDANIFIYNTVEVNGINFNFVQGANYFTIVDDNFKYLNKHFSGIIDYREAFGDKFIIIRDKNKIIYQTLDGKKLNNEYSIDDIKYYGFGYYAIYSYDRQKITMYSLSDKNFSKDFVSASIYADSPNEWPTIYNLNGKIYIEYKKLFYDKNGKIIRFDYDIENVLIDKNFNDYIVFKVDNYNTKILDYNLNEIYNIDDNVVSVKKINIKKEFIYVFEYADSKDRGVDIYSYDFKKSLISSKNHKIEDVTVVGNFIKFKLNNFVYSLYLDNFERIKNYKKVKVVGDTDYIFTDNKVVNSTRLEDVYVFKKDISEVHIVDNGRYYYIKYIDGLCGLYKSNFTTIVDDVLKISIYKTNNKYEYFTYLTNDKYCLSDFNGNILKNFEQ